MFRLIKVSTIALAAVLALVSGCKKPVKNITPIPGYGSTNTSTAITTAPGGESGLNTAPPRNPIRQNFGDNGPGTGGTLRQNEPTFVDQRPITAPLVQTPTGGRPVGGIPDRDTLKADTVYFDYDKSAVKASEKSKVAAVADYLKSHPDQSLLVEGNCDERGTDEYNRALGERRALSVREMLIGLGTPADHITTTSWGKDRPAELGHDEAAWSKNRRGEFVLITPGSAIQ